MLDRNTTLSSVGVGDACSRAALLKLLPVQEVVFVEVSDTGSDFAGHPLQLQQLSVPEHPILLRQVAAQIPLQTHTGSNI